MRAQVALVMFIAALGPAIRAQSAEPESLRQLSGSFQSLAARVDPSVVQIITRGFAPTAESGTGLVEARKGSGSGVIVDPNGYVITNAYVIGSARRVQVVIPQALDPARHSILKPPGKTVPAEVVGLDRETDVAVLKVAQTGLHALPFADSDALRQGQIVFAFGSPFGLQNSVTMGIISSVARQVREDDPMIYIQTDASINPGNSGGPLMSVEGAVVGINTFIVSRSGDNVGIGFAVPSNIVRTAYEQIRKDGRVRRGQIGVVAQTISPELAAALSLGQDHGVLIADVAPKSAAEAAGLEVRDIVLDLNGKAMENARQFGVNIYQHAGDIITLHLLRGGQRIEKRVAVLERPRDPDRILSAVTGERNLVAKLGILAVDLDPAVTAILPPLRRLGGAVVAGTVADLSSHDDVLQTGDVIYAVNNTSVRDLAELRAAVENLPHGRTIAVQIERVGQLQFLLVEIE